jgi:hypothetical protein
LIALRVVIHSGQTPFLYGRKRIRGFYLTPKNQK